MPIHPENMTRENLDQHQWSLIQHLIHKIVPQNPFWIKRFQSWGIDPCAINSFRDFIQIPLLSKQELVEDQLRNSPYGTNLTGDISSFTRCHQTSGTTGKPMSWLDTSESWNWFLDCWKQNFRLAGFSQHERFLFPFSFGPFIGFWAGFEGAQQAGHFVFAAGGMSTEARLELIERHSPSVLCCTPTYALRMLEVARNMKLNLAESSVKFILVSGEPGGAIPSVRQKLESGFGARVIDHWGMTDIGPLGIESCENPGDILLLETACYPEILDPLTQLPVKPGGTGELIITNLGRWGMPVIRYRTGDLVKVASTLNKGACSFIRLEGGIIGRTDDMITIRGNNVFPSAVESLIRGIPEIVEYQVTVKSTSSLQQVLIEIEVDSDDESSSSIISKLNQLIKDRLQFLAEIKIVELNSLPRYELKSRRFRKI